MALVTPSRRGMIFVDSSGEYNGHIGRRSSEESEDSYAEIVSNSSEESYYSDGGDLAEYWDPYRTLRSS